MGKDKRHIPRAQRPVRRMGTEVHADRRTRRRRTRGQDEDAAIRAAEQELEEDQQAALDELYDVFGDELDEYDYDYDDREDWMWDE